MKRRFFLKAVSGAVGGSALSTPAALGAEQSTALATSEEASGMPRRVLGRTGIKISVVGFPGLALIHCDQPKCTAALHDAFDRGVNYFDVAPAYGNGDAEIKMGAGLEGIDRCRYYLACKTKMRSKDEAREELERSLQRLKTDHFDVYQLHCLKTPEEVKQALGPGGAMEAILAAKEQGKVRYIGFSAHTTKGALEAMKGFRFDTVMFPINFVEMFQFGFGKPILALAAEQGAAVLAIKTMCRGAWPKDVERTRRWWYRPVENEKEINLAVRFTLSQRSVVAGIPPAFLDLADKAFDVGRSFSPVSDAETEELRKVALTCDSIFRREEEQVACVDSYHKPVYPESPHECCPRAYA